MAIADGKQLLQLAAAVAVAGPSAVVSHESAAYLHSIDLLSTPDEAILTCPQGRDWKARLGVRLHAMTLPAEQVTTVVGLPVTTPARTVIDLARTLSFRGGVVAADSALHRKLVTKPELGAVLATCSQWPGTRQAAKVIDFADGRAESPLESIARVGFADSGLPPPELQVWLGGTAEPVGRVDFYWKQYRTIAEVVHFTWQQITQTPEHVAASIRKAFRRNAILRPA